MDKAKVTTLEEMSRYQILEDISMTPSERMELAFQLAEFALEINSNRKQIPEESSIPWIELHKISD